MFRIAPAVQFTPDRGKLAQRLDFDLNCSRIKLKNGIEINVVSNGMPIVAHEEMILGFCDEFPCLEFDLTSEYRCLISSATCPKRI